jgi:hypothetical protein
MFPVRGDVVVETVGTVIVPMFGANCDILRLRLIQRLCGAVDLVEFG